MCQDSDYLNRYQTAKEIRDEIRRCRGFISTINTFAKRLPVNSASSGLQLWEHRVSLLKAKLLLLGE